MENKTENRILIYSLIFLTFFMGILVYASTHQDGNLPDCIPYAAKLSKTGVDTIDDQYYQVFYEAKMWSFEPAQVIIPQGSTVEFFLHSKDVVHGFDIYEKNVNLMAVPGTLTKYKIKFDKPGVYKITCHEYCGAGHQNMQGEIIVYEK